MNEVTANIPWLPFDPRDWEQLTSAFGRLRSMVGAHGPKLIANNRAAAFFDRCVHKGRLELALVAPDFTLYRLFDDAERQKLTIRVPLNYEEGCNIEPPHDGYWYARRSDLEKLTATPVTPVARAEAELVPAKTLPAEPASAPLAESLRVKPVPPPEPVAGAGGLAETGSKPAARAEGSMPESESERARAESTRWQRERTIAAIK